MPHSSSPYILLVDDEQLILDTLRIHLRLVVPDGWQILTATSGDEALSLVQEELEHGSYPAVAIVDYMMHPMKGSEVLVQLEKLVPRTKKIMLTGQADMEAVNQVIDKVSLFRYMQKPWDPQDLERTVLAAISDK